MATTNDEPLPLHELISRILAPEPSFQKPKGLLSGLGTMQALNQSLANQPLLDYHQRQFAGNESGHFRQQPFKWIANPRCYVHSVSLAGEHELSRDCQRNANGDRPQTHIPHPQLAHRPIEGVKVNHPRRS